MKITIGLVKKMITILKKKLLLTEIYLHDEIIAERDNEINTLGNKIKNNLRYYFKLKIRY